MHSALHRCGMGMASILGKGSVVRVRLGLGYPIGYMILFCRNITLFPVCRNIASD